MQTSSSSSGIVRILIVVLTLITAAVHLFLGIRNLDSFMGIMFVLNALGFFGLTGLYLLPLSFLDPYRSIIRWILIGYTALTIVLYFVLQGLKIDPISGLTKAVELGLIGLLLADRRKKAIV